MFLFVFAPFPVTFPLQVRYSLDIQSCAKLVCKSGTHGGEATGE